MTLSPRPYKQAKGSEQPDELLPFCPQICNVKTKEVLILSVLYSVKVNSNRDDMFLWQASRESIKHDWMLIIQIQVLLVGIQMFCNTIRVFWRTVSQEAQASQLPSKNV